MKKHDFKKLMLGAAAGMLTMSSSAVASDAGTLVSERHEETNACLKLAANCSGKGHSCGGQQRGNSCNGQQQGHSCGGQQGNSSYQRPNYIADDEEEEQKQKQKNEGDSTQGNPTMQTKLA